MISRKAASLIADAYIEMYQVTAYGPIGLDSRKMKDDFYDNEYDSDFYNDLLEAVKLDNAIMIEDMPFNREENVIDYIRNLHSNVNGQKVLEKMAIDFINYKMQTPSDTNWTSGVEKKRKQLISQLELDGYVLKDGKLYKSDHTVINIEEETDSLKRLYDDIGLTNKETTFEFLNLCEEHYRNDHWSDSIHNSRNFYETILKQVALERSKDDTNPPRLDQPKLVRKYLRDSKLIIEEEFEVVSKAYGLLSRTGGHPYIAEKDQARLLRQISLSITQFVMLSFEGYLKKKKGK